MTVEHRLVIDLRDLTGVRLECGACRGAIAVDLDQRIRVPADCPICHADWGDPAHGIAQAIIANPPVGSRTRSHTSPPPRGGSTSRARCAERQRELVLLSEVGQDAAAGERPQGAIERHARRAQRLLPVGPGAAPGARVLVRAAAETTAPGFFLDSNREHHHPFRGRAGSTR
jgi:hypothetical protein